MIIYFLAVFSAGHPETIRVLLSHGADVDLADVKAQTPLFVAVVNQHWQCARMLLEAGADPNGSERNLCTPLSVMAQRGYYEGVKVYCLKGATLLRHCAKSCPPSCFASTARTRRTCTG